MIPSSFPRVAEENPKKRMFFWFAFLEKSATHCAFSCNTGVSQYIRAMMTWREPPLRTISKICHSKRKKLKYLLARKMSVNNIKICKNGKTPRTVDSHATPVSKIFRKKKRKKNSSLKRSITHIWYLNSPKKCKKFQKWVCFIFFNSKKKIFLKVFWIFLKKIEKTFLKKK